MLSSCVALMPQDLRTPHLPCQMVLVDGFEVSRRVYVDFEGITLRRKFLTGLEPESINMTIGKCVRALWFAFERLDPYIQRRFIYKVIYIVLLSVRLPSKHPCLFPGSLQIQKLGVLSELSSNGRMLYPVGYQYVTNNPQYLTVTNNTQS